MDQTTPSNGVQPRADGSASKTVLVVEDDPTLCSAIAAVLELADHRVLLAGDGQAALDVIAAQPVAAVVLDLHLPHVSGWAFVEELQQRGLHEATGILICSANPDATYHAAALGADGCLGKPFDLETLLQSVARVLARPSGTA